MEIAKSNSKVYWRGLGDRHSGIIAEISGEKKLGSDEESWLMVGKYWRCGYILVDIYWRIYLGYTGHTVEETGQDTAITDETRTGGRGRQAQHRAYSRP